MFAYSEWQILIDGPFEGPAVEKAASQVRTV